MADAPDPDMVTVSIPRSALVVVAPPPDLVHQGNVAAVVGLDPATYLALCKRGHWAVTRVGRLRVARRADVLAYFAACAHKQTRKRRALAPTPEGFETMPLPPGLSRAP